MAAEDPFTSFLLPYYHPFTVIIIFIILVNLSNQLHILPAYGMLIYAYESVPTPCTSEMCLQFIMI